jgi:hypothetical protein
MNDEARAALDAYQATGPYEAKALDFAADSLVALTVPGLTPEQQAELRMRALKIAAIVRNGAEWCRRFERDLAKSSEPVMPIPTPEELLTAWRKIGPLVTTLDVDGGSKEHADAVELVWRAVPDLLALLVQRAQEIEQVKAAPHQPPHVHHCCEPSNLAGAPPFGVYCHHTRTWIDGAAQQDDYECPRCKTRITVNVSEWRAAGAALVSTGDDYIHHVERVAALVDGDDAKAVAWLHDVIEDNPAWTFDRLKGAGIPPRLIRPVSLLTRQPMRNTSRTLRRQESPLRSR